jgi:hypothetical protein
MTGAEEALMVRRGEIQEALQPMRDYVESRRTEFAGIWLTYPAFGSLDDALTVNVNIVEGLIARESNLQAMIPDGARLEAHYVRFSREDLDTVRTRLRADEPSFPGLVGARLQATETNVPANRVQVYVAPLTDAIALKVADLYQPGIVQVATVTEMGLDSCSGSRLTCGPPWVGGVKIVNMTGLNVCTLGFIVRKPGPTGGYVYASWTAGHCGTATYRRGSSTGPIIGTTSLNADVDGTTADVQVIPIDGTKKTNLTIDDTASCNPCTTRAYTGTAQQAWNADEYGDTVCNNGYVSGKRCGTIRSTDLDNFEYPSGIHLFNQDRATYLRNLGDSGGPIYTTAGSVAAGSHVHFIVIGGITYPVYSHVWEMSLKTSYFVNPIP